VNSLLRFARKPFEIKVDSVDNVVKVVCVLHNYSYLRNNEILEGNVHDDMEEMPGNQLLPCTHTNNRSASTALFVRQNFTRYFNTVGSVPWQADSVSRGKY
jgi:hypothetical protein